jgi:hypothetical protein
MNMEEKIIAFFNTFEFPSKNSKEANIFDVGIHNMYENPFTEILSFILNSNTVYDNRNEFIKHFILELTGNENISNNFCKSLNVETQIITKTGKFIDMIIYNDEYVIALENKIKHIPINPFEDYEDEINIRYNSQEKLYFIFSLYKCENIGKWDNKLIGDVFLAIKNKLQFKHNNKWDYFVEDFLNHYLEEKIQMTEKDFLSCEENFSKFMRGRDYLEDFSAEIVIRLEQGLKPASIKQVSWGEEIALRIRPFENDYPDVVLILNYENKFSISIYYTDQTDKNISELANIVGNKYSQWTESGGKYICFELKKEYYFDKLNDAYGELNIQINKMRKICLKQEHFV